MRAKLFTLACTLFFALPMLALADGSQSYTSPGTYTFTVPSSYETLTVTVNGAGGGGTDLSFSGHYFLISAGSSGEDSSFNGTVVGGGGGGAPDTSENGSGGSPGNASGGDINTAGGGASGGAGVQYYGSGEYWGGSGGNGGQAVEAYGTGALSPGAGITVVVGQGGSGGANTAPADELQYITYTPGSAAQNGSVTITWTDPCPTAAPEPWGAGFLIYSGGTYNIDSQGYDFCIENSSGYTYFVPANSSGEIASFVNDIPYLSGLTTF